MDSTKPDPQLLAQLALRCRQLRTLIEECSETLACHEETPFLSFQLNSQIRALELCLHHLQKKRKAHVKKRGGLLRLFSRKGSPVERKSKQLDWGFEGSARTISVHEMIGFLASSGKTGVLWVYAGEESFMIEFAKGEMLRATSDGTPEGLQLGEILIRQDTLLEEDLRESVEKAGAAQTHLGSYLVKEGRIQPEQLRAALATQVQELFNRLSATADALYRFHEGIDFSDAQDLNLNVTGLLLECARLQDEKQRQAS